MSNRYVVIMAGGKGERFWPQSRLRRPKHLLPVVGEKPMLAQTVDRLEGMIPAENIFIITNAEQREAVIETVPEIPKGNVVGEPVGRDTAAAVGLAKVLVKHRDPKAAFAMLPADQVIHEREGFQEVLKAAFTAAENSESLVTIGVKPTAPATGYGYIQRGPELEKAEGKPVFKVRRFVEKPALETAREYLESGDYFWNAGMFVWQVPAIESALERFTPSLHAGLENIEEGLSADPDLARLLHEIYPDLQKISIDYAVMEKAENVVTLEATSDWDDVGSWPAVARHFPADADGNVLRGAALAENSRNNIVISSDGHLVATVGVDDLIVVHTEDATLVCRKDQAQDIKKLVQTLGGDPRYSKLV